MKNPLPWRIALGAYLVGLALVGFWPTPVDKAIAGKLAAALMNLHKHGVPGWLDYPFIEIAANVAMFIPFGFLLTMALPSKSLWFVAGMSLVVSTSMEVGQLLFISDRFSSIVDIVTNALGAVTGLAAAHATTLRKSAESATASARSF